MTATGAPGNACGAGTAGAGRNVGGTASGICAGALGAGMLGAARDSRDGAGADGGLAGATMPWPVALVGEGFGVTARGWAGG